MKNSKLASFITASLLTSTSLAFLIGNPEPAQATHDCSFLDIITLNCRNHIPGLPPQGIKVCNKSRESVISVAFAADTSQPGEFYIVPPRASEGWWNISNNPQDNCIKVYDGRANNNSHGGYWLFGQGSTKAWRGQLGGSVFCIHRWQAFNYGPIDNGGSSQGCMGTEQKKEVFFRLNPTSEMYTINLVD